MGRTRSRTSPASADHPSQMGFAPGAPANWPIKPDTVAEALDELAARRHEESITLLAPGVTVVI